MPRGAAPHSGAAASTSAAAAAAASLSDLAGEPLARLLAHLPTWDALSLACASRGACCRCRRLRQRTASSLRARAPLHPTRTPLASYAHADMRARVTDSDHWRRHARRAWGDAVPVVPPGGGTWFSYVLQRTNTRAIRCVLALWHPTVLHRRSRRVRRHAADR